MYPNCEINNITFGSPRVGNEDLKDLFKEMISSSFRFTALIDPIPKLPPG